MGDTVVKLNVKRTVFVGLAFFTINAVWQLYNTEIPIMLDKMIVEAVRTLFGEEFLTKFPKTTIINGFMTIDNILALVLLPLFGTLSDKTHTPLGKRTPYVLVGVGFTAISLPFVAYFFTKNSILGVFISLGVLLLAMSVYRSPAVALMPDVTPKPLRSKANAIINIMGAAGNILIVLITLIVGKVLKDDENKYYFILFLLTAVVIVAALAVFMLKVNENKLAALMPEDDDGDTNAVEDENKGKKMQASKKKSLIFLLVAVLCWYMAYGCIETNFSRYAKDVLGMNGGTYAAPMLVSLVAAFICMVPLGTLSCKIGRKRTVTLGVVVLFVCALCSSFITSVAVLYVFFAFIGIAWAAINVNSYPMVVEMAKGADIGRYTGYYYTFQMAAQIATPLLSGLLIDIFNGILGSQSAGMRVLFPYSAFFLVLAAVAMIFVKHGDASEADIQTNDGAVCTNE